jgi:hypothetical protein
MKKFSLITTLGVTALLLSLGSIILSGCGGGGSGGGGGGGGGGGAAVAEPTTKSTNLYLFGTMSSGSRLAGVTTTVIVPNFVDYSAANKNVKSTYPLRRGILTAASAFQFSSVSGTYNNNSGELSISLDNGFPYTNISSSRTKNSGKGSLIATIVTKINASIPAQDSTPIVKYDRPNLPAPNGPVFGGIQDGCKVNYAP